MAAAANASTAARRLQRDLKEIQDESVDGVSASPSSDSNIMHWNASIVGPPETPWEGGIFQLKMVFTDEYPAKPPKVRFTSEIFHPNVYSDGSLCLDILAAKWSPIYTVSTILTSIQSLLTDPNPDSPANPEAAQLLNSDIKAYNRKVRRCAEKSLED